MSKVTSATLGSNALNHCSLNEFIVMQHQMTIYAFMCGWLHACSGTKNVPVNCSYLGRSIRAVLGVQVLVCLPQTGGHSDFKAKTFNILMRVCEL